MSMSAPFEPDFPPAEDGIPAADAGRGAPPPAEGFGVAGEEPDRVEGDTGAPDVADGETPFRTPDPGELRRD